MSTSYCYSVNITQKPSFWQIFAHSPFVFCLYLIHICQTANRSKPHCAFAINLWCKYTQRFSYDDANNCVRRPSVRSGWHICATQTRAVCHLVPRVRTKWIATRITATFKHCDWSSCCSFHAVPFLRVLCLCIKKMYANMYPFVAVQFKHLYLFVSVLISIVCFAVIKLSLELMWKPINATSAKHFIQHIEIIRVSMYGWYSAARNI